MNACCIPEPDQTAMKPGPKKKKIENALPLYEAYIPMVETNKAKQYVVGFMVISAMEKKEERRQQVQEYNF